MRYMSVSYEFDIHLGVIFKSVVIAFFVKSLKLIGKFSNLYSGGIRISSRVLIRVTGIFVISLSFNRQISRPFGHPLLTSYCKTW
jgi:hypothetical protein